MALEDAKPSGKGATRDQGNGAGHWATAESRRSQLLTAARCHRRDLLAGERAPTVSKVVRSV